LNKLGYWGSKTRFYPESIATGEKRAVRGRPEEAHGDGKSLLWLDGGEVMKETHGAQRGDQMNNAKETRWETRTLKTKGQTG